MILLLIIPLLILIFIGDISGSLACGFPKKDSVYLDFIEKLRNDNPFIMDGVDSDSLISSYNTNGFISYGIRGILFGCYVNGIGMVPRWYKSYSEIDKLRDELKNKKVWE
jgi:hypothetical protein